MDTELMYTKSPYVETNNLDEEMREIEKAFTRISDILPTSITHNAPKKERDLQIRFADGTDWDPNKGTNRASGKGLYMYFDGQWNKFSFA